VRIRFETCNLRLDRCELTLKSADVPTLARQQLLFLAFHRRTPIHNDAIALSEADAWQYRLR
jgi:hypothetical protein